MIEVKLSEKQKEFVDIFMELNPDIIGLYVCDYDESPECGIIFKNRKISFLEYAMEIFPNTEPENIVLDIIKNEVLYPGSNDFIMVMDIPRYRFINFIRNICPAIHTLEINNNGVAFPEYNGRWELGYSLNSLYAFVFDDVTRYLGDRVTFSVNREYNVKISTIMD